MSTTRSGAAGPYISHHDGYALAISSLAAAAHLPLMGAYQPVIERALQHRLADALEAAREEDPPLTTPQPDAPVVESRR